MSEETDEIEENGGVEESAPVTEETEQGSHELEVEDSGDTGEPSSEESTESASSDGSDVSSDESPSEDCPPCNKGAPAWMATFADMATLLMAFFVLILSFSDTEIRKFEQINGSIQNAFGIKKIRPTIQIPRGRALLVQDYSPALSERTVINDPNQLPIDPTAEYLIRRTGQSENKFERELQVVSSALSNQIEAGLVQVKAVNNQISVEVASMVQENVQQQDQFADDQTAALLAVASVLAETQASVASEIYMSISETTAELAENSNPNIGVGEFYNNADRPSRLDEVRTQLTSQIEAGSLSVEKVGEMIVLSIASQGSFESGSAELEQQFYSTLSEIGDVVSAGAGVIRIEGHTDNIPIMFSDRFESNWELSAARAASVAAYFESSLSIEPSRLEVAGFGETVPVDTNETAAGRANNRRIEIKIPD
jgi:chemotaxis protein MotB